MRLPNRLMVLRLRTLDRLTLPAGSRNGHLHDRGWRMCSGEPTRWAPVITIETDHTKEMSNGRV